MTSKYYLRDISLQKVELFKFNLQQCVELDAFLGSLACLLLNHLRQVYP